MRVILEGDKTAEMMLSQTICVLDGRGMTYSKDYNQFMQSMTPTAGAHPRISGGKTSHGAINPGTGNYY